MPVKSIVDAHLFSHINKSPVSQPVSHWVSWSVSQSVICVRHQVRFHSSHPVLTSLSPNTRTVYLVCRCALHTLDNKFSRCSFRSTKITITNW